MKLLLSFFLSVSHSSTRSITHQRLSGSASPENLLHLSRRSKESFSLGLSPSRLAQKSLTHSQPLYTFPHMDPARNNPILEQDEDNDTVAPLQGTSESEDTSSFSAPLGLMPTFKPRKSNRISVLAYPTDGGSHLNATSGTANTNISTMSLPAPAPLSGGPPGLFGAGPGSSASPSPPPSAAGGPPGGPPGGMKLPPPPKKTPGPTPVPYTKGDFRTAGIEHHWNDPPTQVCLFFLLFFSPGRTCSQDIGGFDANDRILQLWNPNIFFFFSILDLCQKDAGGRGSSS